MLDVHPPHAPVHGWRDFVTHLLTITAGLLIALGLEAAVEALHHHELAAQARENIEQELGRNAGYAKENLAKLQAALITIDANLMAARVHRDQKTDSFHGNVDASWTYFENAAWLTAHESGALGHMPLDEVQKYASLYTRQEMLEREANTLLHGALQSMAPLMIEDSPGHSSPADLHEMMLRSAEVKVQLAGLKELVDGLIPHYADFRADGGSDDAASATRSAASAASTTASGPTPH